MRWSTAWGRRLRAKSQRSATLNNNVGFNPTQLLTAAGKIAGAATDPTGLASPLNGAKFGFVANNVTGFIQALETIGSTKILASPRILVLNKQRAEIQLGTRLGFQTFSQNFTSTIQQVQFLNTGTLLRIRPFISLDGMIRMEIASERSSGTVTNNIPNQQTAELTTNVMVPDGATLVIGGLMEDEDDFSLQGLPGLSRIPALGYLFGFRQKSEGRRELVVLLTPHIWSPEAGMTRTGRPGAPPPGAEGPALGDPGSGDQGPDGQVPAIAPLPAAGGTGATPGAVNAQVALVAANMGVPVPGRSIVPGPGAGNGLVAASAAEPAPPESGQRKRGIVSTFFRRITGRGDADSRNQAASGDGRNVDNSLAESRFEAGNQRPPQFDPGTQAAPARPPEATGPNPQGGTGEPVTRARWGDPNLRTAARRDDRVTRTSVSGDFLLGTRAATGDLAGEGHDGQAATETSLERADGYGARPRPTRPPGGVSSIVDGGWLGPGAVKSHHGAVGVDARDETAI